MTRNICTGHTRYSVKSSLSVCDWRCLVLCCWQAPLNVDLTTNVQFECGFGYRWLHWLNFTARRYASAVYAVVVCLSVLHKPVLYENGSTKGADFWHSSFLPPILHCVIRKFGYLQKSGTSLSKFVPNSGLWKFRHGRSIALSTKLVVVVVVVDS